jgi:GTP pyrophosphokinase
MSILSERFEAALSYAVRLHRDQWRKARRVPYVAHLLAVASLVLEHGGDENAAIAALLHDAVEDQGGLPVADEIRRRFGTNVADVVLACSDAHAVPKPPWHERKAAHLAHVAAASPVVKLVFAADKLHNARSLAIDYGLCGEGLWSDFRGGRQGTLWYYRSAVEAVRGGVPEALVADLDEAVIRLEQLGAG